MTRYLSDLKCIWAVDSDPTDISKGSIKLGLKFHGLDQIEIVKAHTV